MVGARSLWATGLAISRAVQTAISSRMTSPFSRSVVPVAVRSTIASASPVRGASSTDPLTSTISAWRPVSRKWRAAIRGYLVAIRTTPRRRRASCGAVRPVLAGEHHHAAAVAKVHQLVDLALGLLHEHVLAGDADVGGAGLDVGGHVGRAHGHDARIGEQQLAVVGPDLGGVDSDAVEPVQGVGEQGSARHGDAQPGHGALRVAMFSSPVSAMCSRSTFSAKPTAGSARPKVPSSSS